MNVLEGLIDALQERIRTLERQQAKDSHNSNLPPSSDRFMRAPKSLRKKSGKMEDLFHPQDYVAIYNAATSNSLVLADLDEDDDRILARIGHKVGKFNHNDPANWFLTHPATAVNSLHPTALDRFELLIDTIKR